MLKRQFGTSDIWITVLLHFNLLKQLENHNVTEETKRRELEEDMNHLISHIKICGLSSSLCSQELNLTKVE